MFEKIIATTKFEKTIETTLSTTFIINKTKAVTKSKNQKSIAMTLSITFKNGEMKAFKFCLIMNMRKSTKRNPASTTPISISFCFKNSYKLMCDVLKTPAD